MKADKKYQLHIVAIQILVVVHFIVHGSGQNPPWPVGHGGGDDGQSTFLLAGNSQASRKPDKRTAVQQSAVLLSLYMDCYHELIVVGLMWKRERR